MSIAEVIVVASIATHQSHMLVVTAQSIVKEKRLTKIWKRGPAAGRRRPRARAEPHGERRHHRDAGG
jgi:hypothetical protein